MIPNIIDVSHNDLDGVFAGVLATIAYPYSEYNTSVYYCGYDNVNDKVRQIIEEELPKMEGECLVYITDISVNAETAELIDKVHGTTVGNCKVTFCLLDHHGNKETLALNRYDWACVEVYMEDGIKKTSGTRMFFEVLSGDLSKQLTDKQLDNLERYVELVRKYDTWEWAALGEEMPNKFNTLFKLYTRKLFVQTFGNPGRYLCEPGFTETEDYIITLDEEKKKSYISSKLREAIYMTVGGKCAIVVMAEQYINDLAHEMCVQFENADFAIVVGSKSLSFRTNGDTDVSAIAKLFGGNGHPKASGAQISESIRIDLLSDVFFMLQSENTNENNE